VAQTTVGLDDYQSGSLPGICVFTGALTSDRMVLRTRIVERDPATKPPGPVMRYLSAVTLFENPRAPRDLLVGKLPVDAEHLLARRRSELGLRVGAWVSLLLLVVAAVSAQPWSPLLAIASIAAVVVLTIRRIELRRGVPTPTLIGAGTRVHLANVHERFVEAVEAQR
jgi:hypothetical protein